MSPAPSPTQRRRPGRSEPRAADRLVVPHSASLSLVTVLAQHVLLAIPNAARMPGLDSGLTKPAREMSTPALTVKDGGSVIPAEGPGWGATVNPAWLAGATRQKSARGRFSRPAAIS